MSLSKCKLGICLPSKKLQIGFFCFNNLAKIIGWFHISDICRLFSFAACNCIYHLEFYDLNISSDLMENSSDLSPRRIFRISKIAHAKLFHCVRLFIREFLNNQRQQSYQSFELFQFFSYVLSLPFSGLRRNHGNTCSIRAALDECGGWTLECVTEGVGEGGAELSANAEEIKHSKALSLLMTHNLSFLLISLQMQRSAYFSSQYLI